MSQFLDLESRKARCQAELEARGQTHALAAWNELDDNQRLELLDDLETVPWRRLDRVIESHVRSTPVETMPDDLAPLPPPWPIYEVCGSYSSTVLLCYDDEQKSTSMRRVVKPTSSYLGDSIGILDNIL